VTTTDGTGEDTVVVRRRIQARPETVFSFSPIRPAGCAGKGVDATIEPVPGGELRMNVVGDGSASGRFVEVDPPRRIVFSWGWELPGNPVPPGSSTVEVDLEPDGDATVGRLTHRGLRLPPVRDQHRDGWEHYLERLDAVATGGDPGPDPWLVHSRVDVLTGR
jgi:Activator of Hsp90 ATPase homolog 1-like protein